MIIFVLVIVFVWFYGELKEVCCINYVIGVLECEVWFVVLCLFEE